MTAEKKKTTDAEAAAGEKATPAAAAAAAEGTDAAPKKKPAAPRTAAAKKEAAKKAPAEPTDDGGAEASVEKAAKPKGRGKSSRKAAAGKIRITQVRSQIGFARGQRQVLAGLGLGRIGRSVVRNDDACIRGMVAKVSHLVAVEEVEA